jgi:hypothetical protein
MRRDNRSARILAISKVVAMQRLNVDLEEKASLGELAKLHSGFGAASSADLKAYKILTDLHLFS